MLNRKRETGFTLMEILIVIALISVISVFAIPGIMSWMPDYRLKKAVGDMRSDFQRAKLAAIRERAICAVEFVGGDSPTGYIVYIDTNNNQEQDAGEVLISAVNWAEDYSGDVNYESNTFATNDNGNGWIGFRPTGLPRNPSGALGMGTLRLNNDKGTWRSVILSSAGNLRIDGSHSDELK